MDAALVTMLALFGAGAIGALLLIPRAIAVASRPMTADEERTRSDDNFP